MAASVAVEEVHVAVWMGTASRLAILRRPDPIPATITTSALTGTSYHAEQIPGSLGVSHDVIVSHFGDHRMTDDDQRPGLSFYRFAMTQALKQAPLRTVT
jgi:hypothetical protein